MTQPAPLTDEQLNAIDARANAATKGPWGAYTFGGDTLIEIAADLEETGTGYRARREICRLEDEPMDNDPTHREWTGEEDWAQVQADAEFIKHAPADVAALLAEVRLLRAVLDAEKSAHRFTLRQRNNRSKRLLHLRDLALAGDAEALAAAAKDTLAASVDDHAHCAPQPQEPATAPTRPVPAPEAPGDAP